MRPPLVRSLVKALACRCPNCGQGALFANRLNKVLSRCPVCGLPYFRESGYYLGGMIITYVLTAFSLIVVYLGTLLLPAWTNLSQNATMVFWTALAVGLTLLFVRPAYSLWIALDFWIDPWEPETPGNATEDPRRRPA